MSLKKDYRLKLEFDNHKLVPLLYGNFEENLKLIEKRFDINLISRSNELILEGSRDKIELAKSTLLAMWERLKQGQNVNIEQIGATLNMVKEKRSIKGKKAAIHLLNSKEDSIKTKRQVLSPRTEQQREYIELLKKHDLTIAVGPAGTGKSYIAVARAVEMFLSGKVERIILTRPAVEAGERLGFLPGDLKEKLDPYLRPLYDALYDMLPAEQINTYMTNHQIEIAPLAYMRGRTLNNAFIILDEAQNTTVMQMKMFLTRQGLNSYMVVNGDPTQIDLPKGVTSGLVHAMAILSPIKEIGFAKFSAKDVIRHPLVGKIVSAYEKHEKSQKE